MSPAEYRALAVKAFDMAEEYRLEAKTSTPARAALLLRWADQRDADGWFYLSRITVLHTCKVADCDADVLKAGYCSSHYHRLQAHGDPLVGGTSRRGEPERFLQELLSREAGDECVPWPFAAAGKGYGIVIIDRKRQYAHRFVCEFVNGPAPTDEHQAAHSCGRGAEGCVNPKHLRWATPVENSADKISHGTIGRGEKSANAKLKTDDVIEIRRLRSQGLTEAEISRRFNVDRAQIGRISRRENWAHV